jgi:hypothetical protein
MKSIALPTISYLVNVNNAVITGGLSSSSTTMHALPVLDQLDQLDRDSPPIALLVLMQASGVEQVS